MSPFNFKQLQFILETIILLIFDFQFTFFPLLTQGWQGYTTLLGFIALLLILALFMIKGMELANRED
jgi:hypothetical protein